MRMLGLLLVSPVPLLSYVRRNKIADLQKLDPLLVIILHSHLRLGLCDDRMLLG
jgi:hypothetical protein